MSPTEWDVIVLGAGGAGLAAAVSAAEHGARVIVFESEGQIGGSTQLSAGMFTAADTEVQRRLGVDDSPERFFQHYMDLNQWQLAPGLIDTFCRQAAPTLEWLTELGVEVPARLSGDAHTPGLSQAGVEDVWRGHVPKDQGFGLVEVLDRARRRHRVDLVLHTRVSSLLVEGGAVVGVVADDQPLRAPAVVVATGGLAHDADLLAERYPEALAAGEDLFVVAAPGSRGDHLRLGQAVDAAVAGDGLGLLLVTGYLQRQHHWQSGFPPKSRIHVDAHGRRFMNEDISYAVASGILAQHGGTVWSVFDENGRRGLDAGYADWTPDRVQSEADAGRTLRADSIEELATAMGVPPAQLEHTIRRWNTQLPHGMDPDFWRHHTLANKASTASPDPIDTPPYYAVRTRAAELVCTHAGLQIDTHAQVCDTGRSPVPGLYAAGEAGGGVLGARYVGGGNSVANALTMGRIAGRRAATYAVD